MQRIFLFILSIFMVSLIAPKDKTVVYNLDYINKNMKYIPAGSFNSGASDQDVPFPNQVKSRTITIKPFYMFKEEVSNGLYRWYMSEARMKGDTSLYKSVLPDTLVWRERLAYNEPYVEYYLRHPAYTHYPVVGVSYEQCESFCKWLTEKYNADPKRKFKKVRFDLPDSAQREYAARGGLSLSPFPWGGPYLQNKKGEWLANFLIIDQGSVGRMEFDVPSVYGGTVKREYLIAGSSGSYMGVAGSLNDNADITAPVISYNENGYGLYNMSGNVEEFIKSKGKTMGGSWHDTGYYLQNSVYETYDSTKLTSSERGFRFIMVVEEEFPKK